MTKSKNYYQIYPVPIEDWTDWRWQMRNSICSVHELKERLSLGVQEENQIEQCLECLKMRITPYYLSLVDKGKPYDPIRLQCVPQIYELIGCPEESVDCLQERENSPVPGLVHRYPDRVLFLATSSCYMYCRHCTRRHFVSKTPNVDMRQQYDRCFQYIRAHKEIRDVVVSGGDPLTLPDKMLEYILRGIREIEHVEIIRIGSRVPVVLPFRITDELCSMIEKYHPVWFNTHFNHPREVTEEAKAACAKLLAYGIPLNNQSVLLAGVNDSVEVMKELVHKLVAARVRPYYLYECDLVEGLGHFRTPVTKGVEIIEGLRGWTTGMAIPTYVIDTPGGGGKVPIQPEYVVESHPDQLVLRNYRNEKIVYSLKR